MRHLLAVTLGLCAAVQAEGSPGQRRVYTSQGWNILESENFRFCSRGPLEISDRVVRAAETMRADLTRQWLGTRDEEATWRPKCDIVLHSTQAAYVKSVPGGERTVGCSLINTEAGKVVGRRIDIRADRPGWLDGALAHELTHVVLADHFADGCLPAWADEGMAVLADSDTKQGAHLRDLRTAHSRGSMFRLVELFALEGYPSPHRQAAFYGQSASLVRYLVARGGSQQFTRFMSEAAADGYDAAVRTIYGLAGVADLERRWLQDVSVAGTLARK